MTGDPMEAATNSGETYFGRVLPERVAFTFMVKDRDTGAVVPYPIEWLVRDDPTGPRRRGALLIDCSQVVFHTDDPMPDDWDTARNMVRSIVQHVTDAYSYENGFAYEVEILSAQRGDSQRVFGVGVPVLAGRDRTPPLDHNTILELAGPSLPLRRALADMRQAILNPDDTPFYCSRAVDALQYHWDPEEGEAWPELREALRIDEGWLKTLTKPANKIRHGLVRGVSDEERARAMVAAHNVIDRFIILLHRGIEKLPGDEFAWLDS